MWYHIGEVLWVSPEVKEVNLVEEHLEFLGTLDAIGSGARYPKDLAAARKTYSRNVAQDYLVKTKEILEWIKKDQIFKQL
ncbi:hypothetical protein [Neomoorella thermoacetica]|uniref:hypothetical protein n=1 Tax=Neomoorella thermoacetica TaxID=1525 RepID=UPI0015A711B2|nr:hypothetical protein [Moorella thermoacetica]